ncbi:MAG: chromate transporter [Erysipelotrichaceae bacterium]
MIYLKLFFSFLQVGLFAFGGGYAALPLIQEQVIHLHPWLTMIEFSDIITISQMTPGPIAINTATFVGIQVSGFLGAIVATFGVIFPSIIIVISLAYFYFKYRDLAFMQHLLSGLRPCVVSLIATAGISIVFLSFYGTEGIPANFLDVDLKAVGLFVVAFIILRKSKCNPLLIMGLTGLVGALFSFM